MDNHLLPKNSSDSLLRVSQVCERLAISRSMLYQLFTGGYLTRVKIFGATRVAESEVQRFIETLMAEDDQEDEQTDEDSDHRN